MNHHTRLRVLIVEDDFSIRRLLAERLAANQIEALEAADLQAAREALTRPVDLLILDLGLPDGDGIAFIGELRAWSDLPVLVLSARHMDRDKVAALDAGADDYLAKPFSSDELLARIRSLTRRIAHGRMECGYRCGEIEISFAAHQVLRAGQRVHLTPTEFDVLTALVSAPGRVLTYAQLLYAAWKSRNPDQHHYVRIVVGHLRQKLENDPAQPRHLLTEVGVGYRWQA